MMEQEDVYKGGNKSKEEILHEVAKYLIEYMKDNKADIVDIYNMVDKDGSGSITKEEFKKLFRTKVFF